MESLLMRARGLFHKGIQPASDAVKIVALLADEPDRGLLTAAGSRNHWDIAFAGTYDEARRILQKIQAPVVLCDRDLSTEDWRSVVEGLAACSHRASILLVSKVADDYLWNEIIRRGGYDVLSKPLHEDEVVRAVKLARSYCRSTSTATR